MQEVVRAEVLKLLQAGIIYPISDSPWVSPTQGEEVATRLTSGWRVCIDYRKLNDVTRKDHFPLPFIDQVLERVSGHHFYCFLDGYSRRRPLSHVHLEHMPTEECLLVYATHPQHSNNRIMEVFMDDITIYGRAFEECLVNLECLTRRNAMLWYIKELSLATSSPRKALKLIKQRWNLLSNYHPQQL
uniref:Transposon Ty3-I Gag-Pol polyprotein n=1 Tax=Vitis vinifera TaxID=29760 RepID=A5ATA9_VITVI|nr:hypothetical protein VITISV_007122 [Vitis vinifera]